MPRGRRDDQLILHGHLTLIMTCLVIMMADHGAPGISVLMPNTPYYTDIPRCHRSFDFLHCSANSDAQNAGHLLGMTSSPHPYSTSPSRAMYQVVSGARLSGAGSCDSPRFTPGFEHVRSRQHESIVGGTQRSASHDGLLIKYAREGLKSSCHLSGYGYPVHQYLEVCGTWKMNLYIKFALLLL